MKKIIYKKHIKLGDTATIDVELRETSLTDEYWTETGTSSGGIL